MTSDQLNGQRVAKVVTAVALGYFLYRYIESTRSSETDDSSHVKGHSRKTYRSESSEDSSTFLCPTEFFFEIVPKMMEQVPDPTDEHFAPPRIVEMEYAVRGQIPTIAAAIEKEIRSGSKKYPFESLLYCNIGNPIAVGHEPYTYVRQLISAYWSKDYALLPTDLRASMERWMAGHKPGAYTHHRGSPTLLKPVEEWIDERDASSRSELTCASKHTQLFLTDGASGGITVLMELLMDTTAYDKKPVEFETLLEQHPNLGDLQKNIKKFNQHATSGHVSSGVFCPIPQYPLYSATIRRLGGTIIPYNLDEDNDWCLPPVQDLEGRYAASIADGILPKAFVLINPGNPSGNLLTRDHLKTVVEFCQRHRLVLIADEVYQDNIWRDGAEFVSARQVCFNYGFTTKIASFHSCSKGLYGECGVRGGFMALDNFPAHLVALIDKMASVKLCPNVGGQVAMAAVCTPPTGESRALYLKEREKFMTCMKEKMIMIVDALNKLEGVTCNKAGGAMYAFPRIRFPPKAMAEAAAKGISPDNMYCLDLVNQTGIVTVPGSGFKQVKDTYHFRITLLPAKKSLEVALPRLAAFHQDFMAKYA